MALRENHLPRRVRPEISSASAAIALPNLRWRAATVAWWAAGVTNFGRNGIVLVGLACNTPMISFWLSPWLPASLSRLRTKIACSAPGVSPNAFFQPHGIAHRSHRLVNHDDPSIGDFKRPPICWYWDARHVDDDVMELGSQDREQRVDGRWRELHMLL
jgi:hypothetical protein